MTYLVFDLVLLAAAMTMVAVQSELSVGTRVLISFVIFVIYVNGLLTGFLVSD